MTKYVRELPSQSTKLKAELGAGTEQSVLPAGEPASGAEPESPRPASGADSMSGAG